MLLEPTSLMDADKWLLSKPVKPPLYGVVLALKGECVKRHFWFCL
jgi:hypothetical protein